MKSERLIALLFLLQARRSATAAELATVLEVSERTILRDVAALQAAGVPLWSEPGRGGGIRLMDGWRTKLDGLTGREAGALFVSGVPTALADLGLAGAYTSAQSKLLATLPEAVREPALRLGERFHLDATRWFHNAEELPFLADIAAAVWQQRRLRVCYQRGSSDAVERLLEPLGLVLKAGVWYAVAAVPAETSAPIRSYRVSRMIAVEPTVEGFDRPAGFDLVGYWQTSSAQFDRSLLRDRVRIRIDRRAVRTLIGHSGRGPVEEALAVAGPPDEEGWIELDLAVENLRIAQHELTALGDAVEVLHPPQLRAALAAIGERMAARNADTPVTGTSRRR
jgi:predicted DNA-binding transcriptional regulator YafY